METRRERYSKYREQIRHMREEDFPKGGNPNAESNAEAGASLGSADVSEQSSVISPYGLYLRHRHRMLAFKVVALVLTIAGFVVWWVLMQGR